MHSLRALFCAIVLTAASVAAARAEPGFGFSQSGATFPITTISTAAPNIVRTVTVTCPADGHLWANATGRISYHVTSPNFPGTVAYALSRNSVAMQASFQQNLFGRFVDNFSTVPFAIQRVDGCTQNSR